MKEVSAADLLELFFKTNDLTKLVNKAAQVLRNPLLICDTSYHFLAHSSVQNVKDKSWHVGIKRGNWSYELVSTINALDLDYSGRTHKVQILNNVSKLSTFRRMIGTLCVDGSHFGYYLVLEENTPFDEIDEETYRQVERVLAKCVSQGRPFPTPGRRESCESIIVDLLQSHFDSERLFQERAARSELAHKGNYRVFCVNVREHCVTAGAGRGNIGGRINELRSAIGQCLPLSWQVYLQEQIVVLADFSSKLYQRGDTLDSFAAFLRENSLSAGQSDSFSDAYYLKRYYEQARTALYLGGAFGETRQIIPYEDYKVYSLFLHVQEKELFTQYGTETIRAICAYDERNGTEYFDTVYHYLANHCSVQRTAQALYVHRNTVAYRISRVGELFGLTFDDDFRNYINYTSCLLKLYCERCNPEEKDVR